MNIQVWYLSSSQNQNKQTTIMKFLILTVLTFLFAGHDCRGNHRFTPLDTDNHPCKAENLKVKTKKIFKGG